MIEEKFGNHIRQLRKQARMPLRKLAALLDIDQSTLSKLERGSRPVTRQMLPTIAATFNVDERDLVVRYMANQLALQLVSEEYASEILMAAGKEILELKKQK